MTFRRTRSFLLLAAAAIALLAAPVVAADVPDLLPDLAWLDAYNVVWTTQSKHSGIADQRDAQTRSEQTWSLDRLPADILIAFMKFV